MELVSVGIKRNAAHTIQRECPDYEIPVLQELHGDQSIIIGERRAIPKDEAPDAQTAYDRMLARYNTNDGSAALNAIYRTFDDFRRTFARKN